MLEFFFADWPNGLGPMTVQVVLFLIGGAAGIRLMDDVRHRLEAARRSD